METVIEVKDLVKEYIIVKKESGLRGSIKSLLFPKKTKFNGVNGISFSIAPGEIVGYIGPNGAGKSTTIKMLTGILHPTSGSIKVCGISPQADRKAVVRKLGVVFGQRTQLYWDLRLGESFELLRRIYQIDQKAYDDNLAVLTDVLKLQEFINTPVRQLSLGQRMRGDIAAAMLHSPSVLFLDEPTIGLDADAKHAIRNFIKEINRNRGVTVILTTHDLDDVEQLCSRIIVVNNGKLVEDGPIDSIIHKLTPHRMLVVELHEPCDDLTTPHATVMKQEGLKIWYQFEKESISASELIAALSQKLPIQDISVKEPNVEDAIREVYKTTAIT
ncbi:MULTISPECIES: ATP-binding cassette domain-containing protein [unclassified Paenibacillus]|uniref:ABC transporter ATP-binding protein n=1 Tax=unclassified Paenibacillus TaxID=185978 RepID=UPI00104DC04A|nr:MULTISPECIES: ATP-binding cassette domain-containing protein [unclassified Paenibacillus]NIK69444.1 ABC-2 type transport system ATP-binding protein [Paenibacillus sp. BK720]TCM86204.1 ABC-2 type transport system ATP-binding protein [Paenibacillus sp. BK033]